MPSLSWRQVKTIQRLGSDGNVCRLNFASCRDALPHCALSLCRIAGRNEPESRSPLAGDFDLAEDADDRCLDHAGIIAPHPECAKASDRTPCRTNFANRAEATSSLGGGSAAGSEWLQLDLFRCALWGSTLT